MRILLISAYDAVSHRRWREGLIKAFPEHDWTVLSLKPRFFSWRMRGNPYSLVFREKEVLTQRYDLMVVTSMTDLSTLRGLMPHLALLPTVVYFHENQFAYPVRNSDVQREIFHFCMANLYTALCATTVVFNSMYNRDSFFTGAYELLKKMPDFAPKQPVRDLEPKVRVLSVPLEERFFKGSNKLRVPRSILWNHRWEYDKAPDVFFNALKILKNKGIDFSLFVVGQRFKDAPDCFEEAKRLFQEEIQVWGYVELSEYELILQTCAVVVSTALHEFQGLALQEAIASGATPIVPDRLAYVEYVPENLRYRSSPEDQSLEANSLAEKISEVFETEPQSVDLSRLSWGNMKPAYGELLIEHT
ncbi:MAG: glycosyl transferase family 1 [Proteobacteria bacterium]|nr:glycosyl transferase family 1 [Pseudomonadota bacterium]